jgi:exopolyphosphatase / guanosine-5'-triphosphate,3'-diphosphate pyrophosphatase
MRYAVLDLGSTSFQLLVTEAGTDGGLTHVLRDRVILNLGATLAAEGHIPQDQMSTAARVVRRFRDIAERSDAQRVLPIATSALRDAANRPEVSSALAEAAGAPIRFIDGVEEGRLVFLGILASVALGEGATLAFDLGGGSLEVVIGDRSGLRWAESFPLGAARLNRALAKHDPITRSERREIRALVEKLLKPVAEIVAGFDPVRCIAAGGTAGALGRLLAAPRWNPVPSSLNQYAMPLEDLRDLSRTLCAASLEERLGIRAMDVRRADLLHVGSVVLAAAASMFGIDEILHSEWGLREGVVIDELGIDPPGSPEALRASSIARLGSAWGLDAAHVGTVRRLALSLFDETRELHGLGDTDRELLAHGATLHDIGVRVSPDHHHKHGAYLVEHAGLRGFSPEEVATIASLVRFHRGSGPKASYTPFEGLDADRRRSSAVLAGLLRIAHALRRGAGEESEVVHAVVRKGRVRITVGGTSDLRAALDEAQERSDVLSRALDSQVELVASPEETSAEAEPASA